MNSDPRGAAISLSPPSSLLPPQGCGGFYSSWKQLIKSIEEIYANDRMVSEFLVNYPWDFKSPDDVIDELAADPTILRDPIPPSSLFARTLWVLGQVASTSKFIGLTFESISGLPKIEKPLTPSSVAEVFTGASGTESVANAMAGKVGTFVSDIGSTGDLRKTAFADFQTITTAIEAEAKKIASVKSTDVAMVKALAGGFNAGMTIHMDNLRLSAANVSVAVVLDNLVVTLNRLETSWQTVATNMKVAGDSPTFIKALASFDPTTMKQVETAAGQWKDLTQQTKAFIGLIVGGK